MAAIGWALRHPANRGRGPWVLWRWGLHQVRKRLRPGSPVAVCVGPATLVGPPSHPSVCLARYVRGGLADIDAFLVYRALLDDGDTFVDVGANIGLHAVFAASLVGPHGRVVACEPDLGSGGWLERNLKLAGAPYHIETRPLADRRRCLGWISAGETLSHLDLANGPRLETTTLDALFGECELDPTRAVVKLDVEGWEPTVLLGGRETIGGLRALWVEALGLQRRSDVVWEDAVRLCHHLGLRFWVVDVSCARMDEARNPDPRSPTGDYLIAGPAAAARVGELLRRLEARPGWELMKALGWR